MAREAFVVVINYFELSITMLVNKAVLTILSLTTHKDLPAAINAELTVLHWTTTSRERLRKVTVFI